MAEVEIKKEHLVYAKPRLITDNVMHYCPGCSHGTVHKLVAEVIDELGLAERTVGISPVGCSVFAYNYIDIDWIEAAHGRALAVATAVKRLHPENMVFTYQGDGDLSAIGTAETIHAAADYLRAYAIDTLLTSLLFCFIGYFNGRGNTTFVMAQGIVGAFLVRIPVSLAMSRLEPVSLFRVGLATPCSTVVQIVLFLGFFAFTAARDRKLEAELRESEHPVS